MANCTLSDTLCKALQKLNWVVAKDLTNGRVVTKNTTQTACNQPIRDRSAKYNETVIPLGIITIIITVTRLVFKQSLGAVKGLRSDDWTIMGTLAICVSGLVIGVYGLAGHGLGKDIWTLTTHEISQFALYIYIMEILYFAGISLIKLSLSLFYLQIFSGTIVRVLLWATVVFNTLYGLIFVIGAVLQCSPVSYYWEQYTNDRLGGSCVNINLFGWLNAGIGVFIDLWMIGLPLSQVLTLRLHWKKKVGVTIMFMLGTL